ncbi:MAG: restriction endonuclease subunit S [Bacilli bacterium]|nr:restriction endonuclease subunit S [Bacilli bacterium]
MSRVLVDSGIDWIGKIPTNWNVQPLGLYLKERKEKVSDIDYEPLSVTKNGIVPQLENAAKSDAHDQRKKVCKFDFVINSRSDRKQSCGISYLEGSVSLINIVLKIYKYYPEYIKYALDNNMFSEEFYRNGHGIVADLWTTKYSEMKHIRIPEPNYDEQKKIAKFLDEKVKLIDETIENNKKEIELLDEYKVSFIDKEIFFEKTNNIKLKYLVKVRNEKGISKTSNEFISLENIESRTGNHIITETDYSNCSGKIFKKGDLLINKLRPYLAKSYLAEFDGVCTGEIEVISVFFGNINYLKYYTLSSKYIDLVNSSTYGTKMPRANWNFIKNMLIPNISIEKQTNVVNNINNINDKINQVIQYRKQIIEKLEEYKKSLIYEAVTGKIEV